MTRYLMGGSIRDEGKGAMIVGRYAAFFFKSLRHFERNFLRALPWRPISSACFEHSSEAALRGLAGKLSLGCATVEPLAKSNVATSADAPSQLEKYLGIDVCSFEVDGRDDNHQVYCVFRAIAKFG